jgi:hypothetical protein
MANLLLLAACPPKAILIMRNNNSRNDILRCLRRLSIHSPPLIGKLKKHTTTRIDSWQSVLHFRNLIYHIHYITTNGDIWQGRREKIQRICRIVSYNMLISTASLKLLLPELLFPCAIGCLLASEYGARKQQANLI